MRILVAGIGNVFFSDDGFGVEVVQRMQSAPALEGVRLMDVGIRGVHLTFELMDRWDAVVLIDAARRGESPGTVTVLTPDVGQAVAALAPMRRSGEAPLMDSHGMGPVDVISVLHEVEGAVDDISLVLCEPASTEEGIGLSPAVASAVPAAVDEVRRLIADRVEGRRSA